VAVYGGSQCAACHASSTSGDTSIHVYGSDAAEVEKVTRGLMEDEARRRSEAAQADRRAAAGLRNPWISGSFYLLALVVVIVALLVVSEVATPWVLPVVVIGAVLAVTIVGGLQLRQDDRLGEKSFLELMRLTLARLPLIARLGERSHPPTP
jgi:Flp pilus assembly protein TadB